MRSPNLIMLPADKTVSFAPMSWVQLSQTNQALKVMGTVETLPYVSCCNTLTSVVLQYAIYFDHVASGLWLVTGRTVNRHSIDTSF